MDYENNILEEKMKSLPPDLQAAMVSVNTANQVQEIAEKHGLHVDQAGELAEITSLVMLGIMKSKDFISELSKKAEISVDESTKIAGEINSEVFGSVRLSLQKIQEKLELEEQSKEEVKEPIPAPPPNLPIVTTAPSNAAIEQAGQFTVEKNPLSASPQYKEDHINKENLLKSIEDKPAPPTIPMVDHLLTTHVNTPEKVEVKTPPIEKKSPYTADPYREEV